MRRDFSESAYQELLQLVREATDEKWCDFTDWIGDRWYDFQSWIGELDIQKYLDNVNFYHKKIIDKNNTSEKQIRTIFENVNKVSTNYKSRFEVAATDMRLYSDLLTELADTMDPAKGLFSTQYIGSVLENVVSDYKTQSKNLQSLVIRKLPRSNPAFDDYGSYGGNQGSAQYKYRDEVLQSIVRRYYPNFSDKEIKELLQTLNSEGCGYVALCNTIFAEYEEREEEFMSDFGFPMYRYGELNYDAIVVDLYCSKDNAKTIGTYQYEREQIWEKYLEERGVWADVTCDVKVTPETYDEIARKGQLIVAVNPTILEDAQGNIVDDREGGHAMTVTGVTEDGRYIVSSWGRRFYVDPQNDYDRIQFQQVRYES